MQTQFTDRATIVGKVLLLVALAIALAFLTKECERDQERALAKGKIEKHLGKTYVIGNDTVLIDSNFKVR